jgi:hypothetical protein
MSAQLDSVLAGSPYDPLPVINDFKHRSILYYSKYLERLNKKQVSQVPICFRLCKKDFNPSRLTESQACALAFDENSLKEKTINKDSQLLFACLSPAGFGKSFLLKSIVGLLENKNKTHKSVHSAALLQKLLVERHSIRFSL